MKSFKQFLLESNIKCEPQKVPVKWESLQRIEEWINALWKKIGVDVFLGNKSAHFYQRLNDARNGQQISLCEIQKIFLQVYSKYGKLIASKTKDFEGVLSDFETDVNIPFFLEVFKDGRIQLRPKTILRKPNYQTSDPKFSVD